MAVRGRRARPLHLLALLEPDARRGRASCSSARRRRRCSALRARRRAHPWCWRSSPLADDRAGRGLLLRNRRAARRARALGHREGRVRPDRAAAGRRRPRLARSSVEPVPHDARLRGRCGTSGPRRMRLDRGDAAERAPARARLRSRRPLGDEVPRRARRRAHRGRRLQQPEDAARLLEFRSRTGPVPAADTAWLLLRGLQTLDVRVARQTESASAIAEHLRAHPAVLTVRYPGFGGLMSFDVESAEVGTTGRDVDDADREHDQPRRRDIADRSPSALGGLARAARPAPAVRRARRRGGAPARPRPGSRHNLTMGFLDRIRYQGSPKTPQDADRLALRQLAGRGADLAKPRMSSTSSTSRAGRRPGSGRGGHRRIVDGGRRASERDDRPVVREGRRSSHARPGYRRGVSLVVRERGHPARGRSTTGGSCGRAERTAFRGRRRRVSRYPPNRAVHPQSHGHASS